METKECYLCKENKVTSEFNKDRSKKSGLQSFCRCCSKNRSKEYREANREDILKYKKNYREANREAVLERHKKYRRANKPLFNYHNSKSRARKLRACPDWLTQDHHKIIADLYATAQQLTEETGILHHVDHKVPLKGKSYDLGTGELKHTVSGLHVPWNLEVIPAEENLSKNCRYSEWETGD